MGNNITDREVLDSYFEGTSKAIVLIHDKRYTDLAERLIEETSGYMPINENVEAKGPRLPKELSRPMQSIVDIANNATREVYRKASNTLNTNGKVDMKAATKAFDIIIELLKQELDKIEKGAMQDKKQKDSGKETPIETDEGVR